jgi:hypothetical protein
MRKIIGTALRGTVAGATAVGLAPGPARMRRLIIVGLTALAIALGVAPAANAEVDQYIPIPPIWCPGNGRACRRRATAGTARAGRIPTARGGTSTESGTGGSRCAASSPTAPRSRRWPRPADAEATGESSRVEPSSQRP